MAMTKPLRSRSNLLSDLALPHDFPVRNKPPGEDDGGDSRDFGRKPRWRSHGLSAATT